MGLLFLLKKEAQSLVPLTYLDKVFVVCQANAHDLFLMWYDKPISTTSAEGYGVLLNFADCQKK